MARPLSLDKLYFTSVGLRQSDWDWLQKFFPGENANRTDQLKELVALARKFWPEGPFEPPRCSVCGCWLASADAECNNCKSKRNTNDAC